ncbi:MAG: hypothetical protein OEU26_37045 [Candidatus Tectomicrobia bacterium]|nr:hypothetical protein [Candidatus Tectomicrobia bacterium]
MTHENKAHEIVTLLKARRDRWDDSKFPKARVWFGDNAVRVYTGHGREFVEVGDDITTSQTNMSWGGDIDDVIQEVK